MLAYFKTLRFRLAAAFLVWSTLFQAALMLVIPWIREQGLRTEFDTILQRFSLDLHEHAQVKGGGSLGSETLSDLARTLAHGDEIYLQSRDAQGHSVGMSANLRGHQLPWASPVRAGPPGGSTWATTISLPAQTRPVDEEEGTPHRARMAIYRLPGDDLRYLQVAASLAMSDRLSERVNRALLIMFCAGAGAAAVAGLLVADRVARRIEQVAGAVRDVSAKRLDERLDIPEGSDEIGRMAADVNAMIQRLARAFRAQERFISDVSHELKTPLSALLTEAQVLKYARPTERDYQDFVLSAEDEMRRLGSLVESFLLLARMSHGRRFTAQAAISLNDVAMDAVKHASLLAEQHKVNLHLKVYDGGEECHDALVRGDSELLRIALDNIVRNAVQFSNPHDTIHITVGCEQGDMTLTVRDHGPGVAPDYLDRIFNRFEQAPGRGSGRRGSGLGLAIAHTVIQMHSGSIQVHNCPDGGCMFTIRLPMVTEAGSPF